MPFSSNGSAELLTEKIQQPSLDWAEVSNRDSIQSILDKVSFVIK